MGTAKVDPPRRRFLDKMREIRLNAGDITLIFYAGILTGVILIIVFRTFVASRTTPLFYLRIVGVEGLDPGASSPLDHGARPPAFHLTVDVSGVPEGYTACVGGMHGWWSSMLRVSYHGMVLAWGAVPSFCIDGQRLRRSGGAANDVATVYAKAESVVLGRSCMVDFDVEGHVAGLGYLKCKTPFFEGEHKSPVYPCQVY
uniref:Late embryogenesis abundant protein LEA-2 subgroup domain-containing protein n=1 Tax=Oryza punctata TaxID=4537 RepID=A0A0E0JLW5_ORYPU